MLVLDSVSASYGDIRALNNVSLHIKRGEIFALLGANGAGKTSTLHSIVGLLKVSHGTIEFLGERIENHSTVDIVRRGISLVFEGRRLFPELTVRENMLAGAYMVKDAPTRETTLLELFDRFPLLAERQSQIAGSLSGGEQQMLAIARALISKPSLLLMDEPSMGLAPLVVDEVFKVIAELNVAGTTILLVEQNAHRALEIASRAAVLETGSLALSGTSGELLDNEAVRSAYLGI
ncbi:MAG TPA: ABC transporter ATP-binding protein [Anaerolineae bacterium]|nr:ABC transporter ATP-binding protein [Anaerolineae bacterium]